MRNLCQQLQQAAVCASHAHRHEFLPVLRTFWSFCDKGNVNSHPKTGKHFSNCTSNDHETFREQLEGLINRTHSYNEINFFPKLNFHSLNSTTGTTIDCKSLAFCYIRPKNNQLLKSNTSITKLTIIYLNVCKLL